MADIRLKKITVEPNQTPLIIQNGDVSITSTTPSSSSLSGALVSDGGISIGANYESISSSAGGALTVGGGMGVMKSVIIGKNLSLDSSNGLIMVGGLTENRLFLDTVINKQFWISPDGINKRFHLSDTNLHLNITTNSVNSSTGSLTVLGGISINSSENSLNGSNGGALTVAGGVAIGKDLNVSNNIYVGQSLRVHYTGNDQIILENSSGSNSSSLNMINDNLYISNDKDVNIQSSTGIINLTHTDNVIAITENNTNITRPLHILDTTSSLNPTNASLILEGGQSIKCSTDATSISSGGSFTTLGGVSIAKKMLTGDSIGIDIQNMTKSNKLILYQEINDLNDTTLFAGIGNISGGSMIYNVPSQSDNHIFYNNFNQKLFTIKGTNEVVFGGSTQSYSIKGGGFSNKGLSFQSNLSEEQFSLDIFTYDGNLNNNNSINIFGYGTYDNNINSEFLNIGWDTNIQKYIISSKNIGTGIKRDLVLQSGELEQINIKSDGSTIFNSTFESINASSGSVILQGGLSINTTANALNVSSGGALTIAGGASINKNLYIGEDIIVNAKKLSNIKFTTLKETNQYGTYGSLQIISSIYPSLHLTGNPLNPNPYQFNFKMFSLGTIESDNNEYIGIETSSDLNGYIIYSKLNGSGEHKYIGLYSNDNVNQLILQTSGNIGINKFNPNYTLDINGTFHCNNIIYFTNTAESLNSSTGSFIINGGISISNITEASSFTQGGAITCAGGVGIGKNLIVGGVCMFQDSTPSNSSLEASVIIEGGLSVKGNQNAVGVGNGGGLTVVGGGSFGGDLYVGGSINGSGSSSSTYAYLTLTATDEAINFSSGSLVTFGGITTQLETNSSSVTDGGALLVNGGASIGKDIYIGGNANIYGQSIYYIDGNNNSNGSVITLYDNLNIKRFSFDKNTSSHNFSIARFNSLGDYVEKSFEISNDDGKVIFNNTSNASSSVIFKGGILIENTQPANTLNNGGGLTINGGASINKNLLIGGDVTLLSTTESNDVSTGSLLLKGGAAIKGNLNVLGNTLVVGNLTVNGQTTSIDTVNTTIKDNVFVLNSGPSGSRDSGFLIERYQQDNNDGLGDVVFDMHPIQFVIPNQSGLTSIQIKLPNTASAIDNYYKGWWIKVSSGFSSNQVRKITSYDSNTKIVNIISSWASQNPAGGDLIYLYNKPFVGVMYNEQNDIFEFGSTTINPNESTVAFTDYLPVKFSSTIITSTATSSSISSGSIRTSGGITILNTTDSSSITSGGTFLTLGGASIGKTLYVGNTLNVNNTDMTPNSEDIFKAIEFTASNNQTSFTHIQGLIFSNLVWGFDCYLTAQLVSTTNMYANFHIRGVNKNNTWEIVKTYVGDDMGIEFDITNYGQVRYTSQNYDGFVSLTFKFRALCC